MRVAIVGMRFDAKEIPIILYYAKANCMDVADISIVDFTGSTDSSLIEEALKDIKADYIIWFTDNAISSQIFSLKMGLNILSKLKAKMFFHSYKISPEYAMDILNHNPHIQGIIRGDAEQTLRDILLQKEYGDIAGLSFRKDGKFLSNIDREISRLELLPSPYLNNSIESKLIDIAYISASRGCIFNCFYCHRGRRFPVVRRFPNQRIIDEILYVQKIGATRIYFTDDCLISKQDVFEELVTKIWDINNGMTFEAQIRPEFLTTKNIDLLRKMNMKNIQIGLQTTNAIVRLNRNTHEDFFRQIVCRLKEVGINVHLDLILGLPGDGLEGYKKTLDFAIGLNPESIKVNRLFVHPDSNLSSFEGFKFSDYSEFLSPIAVSSPGFSIDDFQEAEEYTLSKGHNIDMPLNSKNIPALFGI
jgi:hypothetical protein